MQQRQECAPLHQEMHRPPIFEVVQIASMAIFESKNVVLPRNIEKTSSLQAPLGLLSGQAGVTSTRQALAAVQAASGISFIPSSTNSTHAHATWLCAAIDSEIANALESLSKNAPHQTVRSRSISITLLLPDMKADQASSMHYANAFAAIAMHRVEKNDRVDDLAATGRQKRPLTARVRFNLACGAEDVADILAFWNIKCRDWKRFPSLVFTFLEGAKQSNVVYNLDGSPDSPIKALGDLQAKFRQSQQLSNGVLVLPAPLLDTNIANSINCTSDSLERLQQTIQLETKMLFCPDTVVSPECGASPKFITPWGELERSFVRVVAPCRPGAVIEQVDPQHCPGIMLSQERDVKDWSRSLTNSYVKRSSMASVRDGFTQKWHLYILNPPVEEEVNAGISVLWFPVERVSIGQHISCFAIKSTPGAPVTCFPDSTILRVQPRVQLVVELLNQEQQPKWVLPVSPESVVSDRMEAPGTLIYSMNKAFCALMDDAFTSLVSEKGLTKLTHVNSAASDMSAVSSSTVCDTSNFSAATSEQLALLSIMQVAPGTVNATVGDVYAHMGEQSDIYTSGMMASFHGVLSEAVKAGRSRDTLKRIFDESADYIKLSHLKRAKAAKAGIPLPGAQGAEGAEALETKPSDAANAAVESADTTGSTLSAPLNVNNAHSNTQTNAHEILVTAQHDETSYLLSNRGLRQCALKCAGCEELGGEICLPKRCDIEGAQKLLHVLAAVDSNLANLDVNELSTPKSTPKSSWIDFLLEVIGKSVVLQTLTHVCAAESLNAKNRGKAPMVFELKDGEKHPATSIHFLRKPCNPCQLSFYFAVGDSQLPFTLTINGLSKK